MGVNNQIQNNIDPNRVSVAQIADEVDSGPKFLPIKEDLARPLGVGVDFDRITQPIMPPLQIPSQELAPRSPEIHA
jgi:hypothetical protein